MLFITTSVICAMQVVLVSQVNTYITCESRYGILVFFPKKSVGPPLRFNKKTPDPPPLGD